MPTPEFTAFLPPECPGSASETLVYSGIEVRIDRPVGFVKRGVGLDGRPWETVYTVPYGEIVGTSGGDGEPLDVFCGPDADAPIAYWMEKLHFDGTRDEIKLGLGWLGRGPFKAAVAAHMPRQLMGRVWAQPVEHVKALLGLDPWERDAAMKALMDLGVGDVHVPTTEQRRPRRALRLACYHCKSLRTPSRHKVARCTNCGRPFHDGLVPMLRALAAAARYLPHHRPPVQAADVAAPSPDQSTAGVLGVGSLHPVFALPLTGRFTWDPDFEHGWIGWIEDQGRNWVAFIDPRGRGLFWNRRAANGDPIGKPYEIQRPDLALFKEAAMTTPASPILAADLTTEQRKHLPANQFALPDLRKYPIDTAARTRDAAARLEQQKKTMPRAQYKRARKAIAAAAKRFGIKSIYNAPEKKSSDGLPPGELPGASPGSRPTPGLPSAINTAPVPGMGLRAQRRRGLHVRIGLGPNGQHHLEILHARQPQQGAAVLMSDEACFTDLIGIDSATFKQAVAKEDEATKLEAFAAALSADVEGADTERARLRDEAQRLREDVARPVWNQVAKVGVFKGHPSGPFELNAKVFDEIVKNFIEVDNGQVCVDFEHSSEADESSGSIPQAGAPAQGWVLQLDNRGAAGLWGLIDFFALAREYVREGKYKFFSPAIRFGAKHPETGAPIGARLTSVGMVNRPFLRGLQPLAARDAAPGATTMSDHPLHEKMKQFKACMGLHPLATQADMKDHLEKLREHSKEILDKPFAASHGHMSASGVNCGDYIPPMAEALNAPDNMSVAEVLDAVEDMIDAAMAQHVAEYHPMSADGGTPLDPNDVAVKLGQTQEQVKAKDGEIRTLKDANRKLMSDKAALDLQLKNANVELETRGIRITTLEGEVTTLRDAEAKRSDAEITTRVEEAFGTYKDLKKLTADDKEAMLLTAKTKPELFAKLYPVVPPDQRHLMRNLTGDRRPGTATAPHAMGDRQPPPVTAPGAAGGPGQPTLDHVEMVQLSDRLRSMGVPNEIATNYAYCQATGRRYPGPWHEKLPATN